ncbi:MAG TPA: YicC/YloC family endoribonuclease [Steroidobacteraceae bacterium]|nr:YicC/YloC family endoribonuclease [Steroidobacteraceae bacterium]
MTGFARNEFTGPFGTLVCEIRSVNHRFLDATLRLPDSARALEPELRQLLSRELKRGKVDCTVQQRGSEAGACNLEIDRGVLQRLLALVAELSKVLPEPAARVDLIELLRFPGILRQDSADSEQLLQAARKLFADTVAELVRTRGREGERLASLIRQRCETLGSMVSQVRARLPEVQARIRARFAERLKELGANVDQDRFEQEVLLMLQRFDVAEELDRLDGHIQETAHTLAGNEPAGRRLDFLMQEFNREANTLSSKSQDLETTRSAVEMKVLIEQMREQVQNIE